MLGGLSEVSKLQNIIEGKVPKVIVVLCVHKCVHLSLDFSQHQLQVHLFVEEPVELCLSLKELLLGGNEQDWCLYVQVLSIIRYRCYLGGLLLNNSCSQLILILIYSFRSYIIWVFRLFNRISSLDCFGQKFGMLKQALGAFPSDLVFDGLLYEPYPLKDVGDVVDSPLLNIQLLGSVIEINLPTLRALDKGDKFLCKFT